MQYYVFVQGSFPTSDNLGIASYHLSATAGESYIKYENTPWELDNGEAPPLKVYFENDNFDLINKRFRGTVRWHPITFGGCSRWEYDFTFDGTGITGGSCTRYDTENVVLHTNSFGTGVLDLRYFFLQIDEVVQLQ